jgi:hypothetical protein
MPRHRRPGTVTAVAVLSFVFGGLALLCSVCSALPVTSVEVKGQDHTQEFKDHLDKELPHRLAFQLAVSGLDFLVGLGLIVGGIGLIYVANWGRVLTYFCIISSIGIEVVGAVYQLALLGPSVSRFFARIPGGHEMALGMQIVMIMMVTWAAITVICHIIQVILLLLPVSARAFRREALDDGGRGAREVDEEVEEHIDDEWEDRPRRRRSRDGEEE